MKALVTGGCGFIGSHLVRRLLKEGHSVSILDTFFSGRPSNLGDCLSKCGVIQGSVTNWDAVRQAMRGCHVVYHLAARMDWTGNLRHPDVLNKTNAWGTSIVLTQARAMGVQQIIFASSAAVYGDFIPGVEGGPCLPVSMYGASKLAAESICQGFNALGLEIVTLRLFNVYGPGGHGVVNSFLDGGDTINGDGSQTRDFVHVYDVVDAMMKAQGWEPGIYNVGTGNETTIGGLWHTIHGDGEPKQGPAQNYEVYRSFADMEKTGRLWAARFDTPNAKALRWARKDFAE
jgi:UDP-glucose 4-epimerase